MSKLNSMVRAGTVIPSSLFKIIPVQARTGEWKPKATRKIQKTGKAVLSIVSILILIRPLVHLVTLSLNGPERLIILKLTANSTHFQQEPTQKRTNPSAN